MLNRLLAYFAESNKEKNHKKFDFSIIGGPHYSTDTKFGVGIMAAGLYYSDKTDSLMPPSNLALYGDVSTVGYYLMGVKGVHLFPKQRYRTGLQHIVLLLSHQVLGDRIRTGKQLRQRKHNEQNRN